MPWRLPYCQRAQLQLQIENIISNQRRKSSYQNLSKANDHSAPGSLKGSHHLPVTVRLALGGPAELTLNFRAEDLRTTGGGGRGGGTIQGHSGAIVTREVLWVSESTGTKRGSLVSSVRELTVTGAVASPQGPADRKEGAAGARAHPCGRRGSDQGGRPAPSGVC